MAIVVRFVNKKGLLKECFFDLVQVNDTIAFTLKKNYPADFSSQERSQSKCQLPHFQIDVGNHPELKELSTLVDLTSGLFKTFKYFMKHATIICDYNQFTWLSVPLKLCPLHLFYTKVGSAPACLVSTNYQGTVRIVLVHDPGQ
jgi:hypothetical protein